eukprot:395560-Prorocentrum_minimum.AAC.1
MATQKGEQLKIVCTDEDLKKNEYGQDVTLVEGTPIMSCKNNKKEAIVNNQDFTVVSWDNDNIH